MRKKRNSGVATFADDEAETLTIELRDAVLGLRLELLYTAFDHHPVITRSARYFNDGGHALSLRRALSCSVDFSAAVSRYQFLRLSSTIGR